MRVCSSPSTFLRDLKDSSVRICRAVSTLLFWFWSRTHPQNSINAHQLRKKGAKFEPELAFRSENKRTSLNTILRSIDLFSGENKLANSTQVSKSCLKEIMKQLPTRAVQRPVKVKSEHEKSKAVLFERILFYL